MKIVIWNIAIPNISIRENHLVLQTYMKSFKYNQNIHNPNGLVHSPLFVCKKQKLILSWRFTTAQGGLRGMRHTVCCILHFSRQPGTGGKLLTLGTCVTTSVQGVSVHLWVLLFYSLGALPSGLHVLFPRITPVFFHVTVHKARFRQHIKPNILRL